MSLQKGYSVFAIVLLIFSVFTVFATENVVAEPDPVITDVSIPDQIYLGETSTLSVTGINYGSEGYVGYLDMSFPDNPYADSSIVSIGDTSMTKVERYRGDTIWYGYGEDTKSAEYPLMEGEKENWADGESHTLNVNFEPTSTGTYHINIKFLMYYNQNENLVYDPTQSEAEAIDEQQQEYCYQYTIDVVKPDPDILDIDIPNQITLGETATLSVEGYNDGAEAGVGYLDMSFPDNPYADSSIVSIGDTSMTKVERYRGDTIWYGYGEDTKSAEYPLMEGEKENWASGSSYTLNINFKPPSTGTYHVNVKMLMFYNQNDNIVYEPTSSEADTMDEQQEEWVYQYTVEVKKPDPKINKIDVPDQIRRGETSTIYVKGINNGAEAEEGYLDVSFPDNPEATGQDIYINKTDATKNEVYQGDEITYGYGSGTKQAEYPIMEVYKVNWGESESYYNEIKFKTNSLGTYKVNIKLVTSYDNHNSYEADPLESSADVKDDQQQEWAYQYTIDVVEPEPDITSIDIPEKISVGDTATLTVKGTNNGTEAGVGYLDMSFPDNPDASSNEISIGTTDMTKIEKYKGDTIWYGYGDGQKAAEYPMMEGKIENWANEERHTLNVNFNPSSTGTYRVNIKLVMYYNENEHIVYDPTSTNTDIKDDQQQEWVYQSTIEVVKSTTGVIVSAPSDKTESSTGKFTYSFTVENTGDTSDQFNLDVVSSNSDWTTELDGSTVTIDGGSSTSVNVYLYIPSSALSGDSSDINLTATSSTDSTIQDFEKMTVSYKVDEETILTIEEFEHENFIMGERGEIDLTLKNQGDEVFESQELEFETTFLDVHGGKGANSFWVQYFREYERLQQNDALIEIPNLDPGEQTTVEYSVELKKDTVPSLYFADTLEIKARSNGELLDTHRYDELKVGLSPDDEIETKKKVAIKSVEILLKKNLPPLAGELTEVYVQKMSENVTGLITSIKEEGFEGTAEEFLNLTYFIWSAINPQFTAELVRDAAVSYLESGLSVSRTLIWIYDTIAVALEENVPELAETIQSIIPILLWIKCPVVPEVENLETGNKLSPTVDEISDGKIEEIEGNDGWVLWLPKNGEYELTLKGTGNGSVNFCRLTGQKGKIMVDNAEFNIEEGDLGRVTMNPGDYSGQIEMDEDNDGEINREIEMDSTPLSEFNPEEDGDDDFGLLSDYRWLITLLVIGVVIVIGIAIAWSRKKPLNQ